MSVKNYWIDKRSEQAPWRQSMPDWTLELNKLVRQIHEGQRDNYFRGVQASPPKGVLTWKSISTDFQDVRVAIHQHAVLCGSCYACFVSSSCGFV